MDDTLRLRIDEVIKTEKAFLQQVGVVVSHLQSTKQQDTNASRLIAACNAYVRLMTMKIKHLPTQNNSEDYIQKALQIYADSNVQLAYENIIKNIAKIDASTRTANPSKGKLTPMELQSVQRFKDGLVQLGVQRPTRLVEFAKAISKEGSHHSKNIQHLAETLKEFGDRLAKKSMMYDFVREYNSQEVVDDVSGYLAKTIRSHNDNKGDLNISNLKRIINHTFPLLEKYLNDSMFSLSSDEQDLFDTVLAMDNEIIGKYINTDNPLNHRGMWSEQIRILLGMTDVDSRTSSQTYSTRSASPVNRDRSSTRISDLFSNLRIRMSGRASPTTKSLAPEDINILLADAATYLVHIAKKYKANMTLTKESFSDEIKSYNEVLSRVKTTLQRLNIVSAIFDELRAQVICGTDPQWDLEVKEVRKDLTTFANALQNPDIMKNPKIASISKKFPKFLDDAIFDILELFSEKNVRDLPRESDSPFARLEDIKKGPRNKPTTGKRKPF